MDSNGFELTIVGAKIREANNVKTIKDLTGKQGIASRFK